MSSPSAPKAVAADPWTWMPPPGSRWSRPVGMLRLEGPDTLRVLHGQTSQALEGARPGQWLGTCCISATARMRALAEVLVDGSGAWLVIVAGDPEAVRTALDRVLFPADRVRLGPVTPAVLHQPLDAAAAEQGDATAAAAEAVAVGTWAVPENAPGWLLGDALLLPAGAPLPAGLEGLRPLEPQEQERWRLQQGLPAAPGEINDETNPFELGLAGRVSLSKGCYVGQETLAKLATYDGVKRQLRRWRAGDVDAGPALAPGTPLLDAGGGRAGMITSSLQAPGGEGWIGLALVRRSALQEPLLQSASAPEIPLHLSIPPMFQSPPVGAGGKASS